MWKLEQDLSDVRLGRLADGQLERELKKDRIRKHQHVSWVKGSFLTIQGSNRVQTVTKEVPVGGQVDPLLSMTEEGIT
ncbi:unnamed protein product, partial [Larinioides sclopetarius]